jgi:hypothetical protein
MGGELLGLLGVFTAVAALAATVWQGYLLRLQLRYFDRVSRAQFYQQITTMCVQRDQIFIEHPDLWPYFYEGRKEPRSRRRRAKVFAMSRVLANLANGLASEKVRDDFDGHWNKYYQYMYENSPSFQRFWKEQGQFWPEETRRRFVRRGDL